MDFFYPYSRSSVMSETVAGPTNDFFNAAIPAEHIHELNVSSNDHLNLFSTLLVP